MRVQRNNHGLQYQVNSSPPFFSPQPWLGALVLEGITVKPIDLAQNDT